MPDFKIIQNETEIKLNSQWWTISYGQKVDEKGNRVGSDDKGRCYTLITKALPYTTQETIFRWMLAVAAIICTLSLAFFLSPTVKDFLFNPYKEVKRFGLARPFDSIPPVSDVQRANSIKEIEKILAKGITSIPTDQTQTTLTDPKLVYTKPTLLYQTSLSGKSQSLNFALIKTQEEEKIVPVIGDILGDRCQVYEGSPLDVLLSLAQSSQENKFYHFGAHTGSPIKHFLNHPLNHLISEEAFFKFILEKDESGTCRLCTLNNESTLEVLTLMQEKNIPIPLTDKNPKGETLFTRCLQNFPILQFLLNYDPAVIDQIQDLPSSTVVDLALSKYKHKNAQLLFEAMRARKIPLNQEQNWIKRALNNDCLFLKESFERLPQDLKGKIYYVANACMHKELITKLKTCGMAEKPLFFDLEEPTIFAANMDSLTAKHLMQDFLKNLRKNNTLLTSEEFKTLDRQDLLVNYVSLSSFEGRNQIKKIIEKHPLTHIKLPEKFIVLKNDTEDLLLTINYFEKKTDDSCIVYTEKIQPIKRQISLEEANEVLAIYEETGCDTSRKLTFATAAEGIYVIDTRADYNPPLLPQLNAIEFIRTSLSPQDMEAFESVYQKKKEIFDQKEEEKKAQDKKWDETFQNSYKNLLNGYSHQVFQFPVNALLA